MTDLLVSSLMTDGGLKTSLLAAIKLEVKEKELEETEDKVELDKPSDTLMTEQAQLESETKRAAELSSDVEGDKGRPAIPMLYLVKWPPHPGIIVSSGSRKHC